MARAALIGQRACDDDGGDRSGAVQLERARAFVERGPAGHHIVDQNDMLSAHVLDAVESSAQAAQPLVERQIGLCRRMAQASRKAWDSPEHLTGFKNL